MPRSALTSPPALISSDHAPSGRFLAEMGRRLATTISRWRGSTSDSEGPSSAASAPPPCRCVGELDSVVSTSIGTSASASDKRPVELRTRLISLSLSSRSTRAAPRLTESPAVGQEPPGSALRICKSTPPTPRPAASPASSRPRSEWLRAGFSSAAAAAAVGEFAGVTCHSACSASARTGLGKN